jgi:hypothetical protein
MASGVLAGDLLMPIRARRWCDSAAAVASRCSRSSATTATSSARPSRRHPRRWLMESRALRHRRRWGAKLHLHRRAQTRDEGSRVAVPMLPQGTRNSEAIMTSGQPSSVAWPPRTASLSPVRACAPARRSRYGFMSENASGSYETRSASQASKLPSSTTRAMRARALWIALAASRTLSRRFVRRAPQPGAWARSTSRAFMTFPIGLRGNASRKHRGHERRAADLWAEFVRARGSMRPAVREPDDREALEPQGVRDYLDVGHLARLSPCTPSAGCRRYRR